jgi:hypothetical protein
MYQQIEAGQYGVQVYGVVDGTINSETIWRRTVNLCGGARMAFEVCDNADYY